MKIINEAIKKNVQLHEILKEYDNPNGIEVTAEIIEALESTSFGIEILNMHDNLDFRLLEQQKYLQISNEFLKSDNNVVTAFGKVFENGELKIFNEVDIPVFYLSLGEELNPKIIYNNLVEYLIKSYNAFEYGLDLDLETKNSLKLTSQMNKKIKINIMANPFYQLNLLFYGDFWSEQYFENLLHFNRPLFSSVLNMQTNLEIESSEDLVRIKEISTKKTISINYQYFVYNILFIISSFIQYYSFRKRIKL